MTTRNGNAFADLDHTLTPTAKRYASDAMADPSLSVNALANLIRCHEDSDSGISDEADVVLSGCASILRIVSDHQVIGEDCGNGAFLASGRETGEALALVANVLDLVRELVLSDAGRS